MQKHRLPAFWLIGNIMGFDGGTNATLDIKEVHGRRHEKIANDLVGTTAVVGRENVKPASNLSLVAQTDEIAYVNFDNGGAGHRFLEEEQLIAAFVEFDRDMFDKGDPAMGLKIVAWNFQSVFEPLKKQMGRHNFELFKAKEEAQKLAEKRRKVPFRIYDEGVVPGPNVKPITMQTLASLAAFFEYRAWPKGLQWVGLINNVWLIVGEPAMLKKPGITGPKPNFRNPRLDELLATVKHIDPAGQQSSNDDVDGGDSQPHSYIYNPGEQIGGIAGLDLVDTSALPEGPKVINLPPQQASSKIKEGRRQNRRRDDGHQAVSVA